MSTSTSAFSIEASASFQNWLKNINSSLCFSTYEIGKLFMVGTNSNNKLNKTERTFSRCMGLAIDSNSLWMSSLFQIWRFENTLKDGQTYQGYDKIFIPQMAYTTGKIDTHDMIITKAGVPVFVNTKFNCLATVSQTHSFKPLWKPDFISTIVAEDRCHLNGLAALNGVPKYVTLVGKSDKKSGWRERRLNGGLVIDVQTNQVVCEGLSMPHSPRIHRGKLWLLEAGSGYLGYVNKNEKKFVPVCFCPGFLRGLDFIDNYAIIGLSKSRRESSFRDLQLDQNLKANQLGEQCGLSVVNLDTGKIEHYFYFKGVVNELYDVKVIKNAIKPLLVGTVNEQIQNMISVQE